jgi:hypothetical protein
MSSIPGSPLKLDLPHRVTYAQTLIANAVAADPKVVETRNAYNAAHSEYSAKDNGVFGAGFGAVMTAAIDGAAFFLGGIGASIALPALIVPVALVALACAANNGRNSAKAAADKARSAYQAAVAGANAAFSVETEAKRFE